MPTLSCGRSVALWIRGVQPIATRRMQRCLELHHGAAAKESSIVGFRTLLCGGSKTTMKQLKHSPSYRRSQLQGTSGTGTRCSCWRTCSTQPSADQPRCSLLVQAILGVWQTWAVWPPSSKGTSTLRGILESTLLACGPFLRDFLSSALGGFLHCHLQFPPGNLVEVLIWELLYAANGKFQVVVVCWLGIVVR